MRFRAVLVLVTTAVVLAASYGVFAQPPECVGVWCLLDPIADPPCGAAVYPGWSVEFTSSPTSVNVGSCSGFTMDNRYTGVKFYRDCSTSTIWVTCVVYSESSDLEASPG